MTAPSSPNLIIVVALACEARPLIDALKLKKRELNTSFQIYCNQQNTIQLIVSGVGNIKAAAATSYIHGVSGANAHTSYLNIGIAGSKQFAVGEALLIHKIIYHATQKAWYPQCIPTISGLKSYSLKSFDAPQTEYNQEYLQDMEAYGFVISASLQVTHEQIQILKIISDNAQVLTQQITPKMVTELVAAKWNETQKLIDYLVALSVSENAMYEDNVTLNTFLSALHFSNYQTHQLKELLRRWHIHLASEDPVKILSECNKSNDVLFYLEKRLQHAEYYYL